MRGPACADGTCGADECPRCGGGGEPLFVPVPGQRGPKPWAPPVSDRLRELHARSKAGGLTFEEDLEQDRLEDERDYIAREQGEGGLTAPGYSPIVAAFARACSAPPPPPAARAPYVPPPPPPPPDPAMQARDVRALVSERGEAAVCELLGLNLAGLVRVLAGGGYRPRSRPL